MYNFDTKEEVDFDYFMELLWNNEFQVVSRKWTQEEKNELSREIAEYRATHPKTVTREAVLA